MGTCDTCKHRAGQWVVAYSRFGPSTAVSSCLSEPWPEWWRERGERPIITPGAGTGCKRYERRTPPKDAP